MKKSMWLYNTVTWLMRWPFRLVFGTKVVGRENEAFDGPAIYCINHMSNWDPVIVACETKRPINFMSKKELCEVPVLKTLLKWMGVIPIDRQGNDLAALRTTITALKNGASICLFPQGTRCPGVDPAQTEVKNGVAMLSKLSGAAIVPIGVYTKDYRVRLFKKVYVSIGKPITHAECGFTGERDDYDRVTKMVFDEVCKLCCKAKEKADAKR